MSANKSTHILNINFITLLKSLKEIAHVPFCFLFTKSAEKYHEALKKCYQASKKKCCQACIRSTFRLCTECGRPAEHFSAGPSGVGHVLRTGNHWLHLKDFGNKNSTGKKKYL